MKIQHKRSKRPIIVTVVALFVFAGGIAGVQLMGQQRGDQVTQVAPQVESVKPASAPTVSEEALPETPVRMVIDKIAVDAEIEPVGLTAEGMMDDPDTNEGVGWYDKSARLHTGKLAMLFDGHYGIGQEAAVFRRLVELKQGDIITVHGNNGSEVEFRVVETERQYTDDVDMEKALYPYREGVQSLTIITCEGEYNPVQATYDKRTILYAERVS